MDRSHLLEVAPAEFHPHDLRTRLTAERRFDLALCLEVAHLLEPEAGDRLVESLAALSDVVLFSAGIPGQRGVGHLNLEWPRYWSERFAAQGLVASNPFRALLWEQPELKWWFAQNLVCFATEEALARLPSLESARCAGGAPFPLAHPGCYLDYVEAAQPARRGRLPWRRSIAT